MAVSDNHSGIALPVCGAETVDCGVVADGGVVVGAVGCGAVSVTGVGAGAGWGAGVVTGTASVGVDARLDVESDARG